MVLLFRSLGLRDEYIIQRIQMVGPKAYANYCEAYNDCAPEDLPRFSSQREYLQHANRFQKERDMQVDHGEFSKFLKIMTGKDPEDENCSM